jgi:hypothetical protein
VTPGKLAKLVTIMEIDVDILVLINVNGKRRFQVCVQSQWVINIGIGD